MVQLAYQSDVIVAGGGLAGIVTALELLDHNRRILVLERDQESRLGGLAAPGLFQQPRSLAPGLGARLRGTLVGGDL